MRIILAHKFFRLTGGADVFFFEVGRVLKENGHEVAYFSTHHPENIKTEYTEYFVNPPIFSKGNLLLRFFNFFKIPYNFNAKRKFKRLIQDFKPDLIHVFNIATQISPSILDVAKRKNIPIVISLNDYKHICPNYKLFHHGHICEDCKKHRYYKAITNKCCHDSLLFSIASSLESYIHHFLNIYKKNISLFLFASDFMAEKTEEFWGKGSFKWGKLLNPFKVEYNKSLNSAGDGEFALYFGRLIDEKGVNILLEAMKELPEIPVKIIGDGPDHNALKEYTIKNGLKNITFTGALWGDLLNDLLYKSKFVVVPSIWHENFPYVILQAFAAGKPVIGSNRGGIPEMIKENERGLIYDADNPHQLAIAINELWNNSSKTKILGANSLNFVREKFNDKEFYNQLIVNYNKVVK